MKKKTLYNCFLALIPLAAFLLATTADSVTLYDIPSQEVRAMSYFAPVDGATVSFLTPFAGFLTVVASVLGLVLVLGKKQGCMPWLKWISMLAACAAVAPLFIPGDIKVVPNFILPLLMMVEYALCHCGAKGQDPSAQGPQGERLG